MELRVRRGLSGGQLLVFCVLLASACGQAGEGKPSDSATSPDVEGGPTPPGTATAEPPGTPPEGTPSDEIPFPLPGSRLPEGELRAQVDGMLARECSSCHAGPSAERDRFLDLERLFENGYVRAGMGELSSLTLWLQYGLSRREHAGVRVSSGELDALVTYMNAIPEVKDCPGYAITDRDQVHELLQADLARRAPADRPFIRYVGAVQATPAVGCTGGPPGAAAFRHLVNAISLQPEIVPLGNVLDGAPIHAIDLRDYGWDQPIDVDGPTPAHFDDRWSAIAAAAGPYALELQGPEADELKRELRTPVPFLSARVFVTFASVGPLYAALVGVGSDVGALASSLGVDAQVAPQRAGLFGAAALPDRVVTRHAQGASSGLSWWTREELRTSIDGAPAGLVEDPVHFTSPGSEVIFSLPNGLFAFAVAGADGRRIDDVPCASDLPCAGPTRAVTSVTCRGCHGDEPSSASDEVLPYLDADSSRYPTELVPLIREQYRADLWRALEADQARSHDARIAATGSSFAVGQSIADVYFDFTHHPLDAKRAANDLGVQVEQLRAAISALGAAGSELAPLLADGQVQRALFTAHYRELACAVQGPRNQPATCP
jgi:hypothetical protein